MEYGIHFSNDSANETILSALEELNNTFFIENSSSESEKNISDNHTSDSDSDIESLKTNFNKIHLNNFEFVENPNNYIEDNIYDDLKSKVKKFFKEEKYSCHSKDNCIKKIGYEQFLACRIEFESLDKKKRDMVVKGQLLAFQKDENTKKVTSNNRKYLRFNYCFNNNLSICRTTYQALLEVSHKYLDAMIQHLRECDLEECVHGNTGKAPKNMNYMEVNYNAACEIYKFLQNYANIHGIPSPGRHFDKISEIFIPVVFLLTSYSYASVYRDYV